MNEEILRQLFGFTSAPAFNPNEYLQSYVDVQDLCDRLIYDSKINIYREMLSLYSQEGEYDNG